MKLRKKLKRKYGMFSKKPFIKYNDNIDFISVIYAMYTPNGNVIHKKLDVIGEWNYNKLIIPSLKTHKQFYLYTEYLYKFENTSSKSAFKNKIMRLDVGCSEIVHGINL